MKKCTTVILSLFCTTSVFCCVCIYVRDTPAFLTMHCNMEGERTNEVRMVVTWTAEYILRQVNIDAKWLLACTNKVFTFMNRLAVELMIVIAVGEGALCNFLTHALIWWLWLSYVKLLFATLLLMRWYYDCGSVVTVVGEGEAAHFETFWCTDRFSSFFGFCFCITVEKKRNEHKLHSIVAPNHHGSNSRMFRRFVVQVNGSFLFWLEFSYQGRFFSGDAKAPIKNGFRCRGMKKER